MGENCIGCCYYPNRWLDMDIVDPDDEDVLHLSRDKRFSCLWYSCNVPVSEDLRIISQTCIENWNGREF